MGTEQIIDLFLDEFPPLIFIENVELIKCFSN